MATLKDFFLPTERNDMVPLLLSRPAFVFYLALGLALVFMPTVLRLTQLASLSEPVHFTKENVIALVNDARVSVGLPALREAEKLDLAAADKVEHMLELQYFAHWAPDKKTPWDFFKNQNYRYVAAGENLAIDFVSAREAHNALMNSPTHRANILNELYTEIGVAVKQGTFLGRPSILVAQYFGKPRVAVAAAPAKPIVPVTVTAVTTVSITSTTPTATAVLGTEAPKSMASEKVSNLKLVLSPEIKLKTVAVIATLSLLIPLGFFVIQMGGKPIEILARSILLLLIFGYATVFPSVQTSSHTTDTAASIVSIYD